MGVRDVLDAVKKLPGSLVSRLRKRGPNATSPQKEASFEGEGSFGDDSSTGNSFPGFAPPPSFSERVRDTVSSRIERIKADPRVLIVTLAGSIAVLVVLLVFAFAFRPPKPISESSSIDEGSLEILRRIPVPRIDPLEEESRLDRPRKARYTEAEVAEKWRDLSALPKEALREKNRAELRALLSSRENP